MSLDFWLFRREPYLVDGEDHGLTGIEHSDSFNVTHNLTKMASMVKVIHNEKEVSLYQLLWHPFEIGFYKNTDKYLNLLRKCYTELSNNPDKFKKYNAPNGWGVYEHFVKFVKNIIYLCEDNPDWYINISR